MYLSLTEITDAGVERLAKQLPQLEYLSLFWCKNVIKPSLKNFNQLKKIQLSKLKTWLITAEKDWNLQNKVYIGG